MSAGNNKYADIGTTLVLSLAVSWYCEEGLILIVGVQPHSRLISLSFRDSVYKRIIMFLNAYLRCRLQQIVSFKAKSHLTIDTVYKPVWSFI